ncbi:MAG: 2-phospho-L-lactate guanylyltransferase [Anaerolineales bacterium]|nr:MAG: 2-phospho-L-lactate guanylyltransferase [Anaerolineales bacterium]
MTFWAIVPVKPLRRAKSRLAGVLTDEERASLSQRLLQHTLDVLNEIPEIEHTLVVSRDSRALALARQQGARTLAERGAPELNRALVRATLVAKEYGAAGVLVLPADLPLLKMQDVLTLIHAAHDPPVVVLVPDRRGQGTNALLVCPSGLIEYDFGPDSFQRHQERAKAIGARLELCSNPSLELDLDLPEDLEYLREVVDFNPVIPIEETT